MEGNQRKFCPKKLLRRHVPGAGVRKTGGEATCMEKIHSLGQRKGKKSEKNEIGGIVMRKRKVLCGCLSLAMACAILLPIGTMKASAATETTGWSLYYNPSGPPAENLRTWKNPLVAHSTTSNCTYSCSAGAVSVSFSVDGVKKCTFPNTRNECPAIVTSGVTHVYALSYVNDAGVLSRPSGTITH